MLLPVANQSTVHQLANLATLFAKANHGELFALHVIKVPPQLGVIEGRNFLEQGRPLLEDVIGVGQTFDVPVRTMLRLGRDVARSMVSVARERETNLMVLGWPGYTQSKAHVFGSIIDLIGSNPPCDLAVVYMRTSEFPNRILVPIAGGPNARLSLELAITQADAIEQHTGNRPEVTALNLIRENSDEQSREQTAEGFAPGIGD